MSIFNNRRLDNDVFKLDVSRLREGWYTDKYFVNIATMLSRLSSEGYIRNGINVGDIEVEMQWFTRRAGKTVVVGIDKAIALIKSACGYFDKDKNWVDTSDSISIYAMQDGDTVEGNGNPSYIEPVLKVRGKYKDFAILETPTLGVLTRASRVATNVYDVLVAANGKPVLFFPARFDTHEVQASDGYSYNIAVQRYNKDYNQKISPAISTDYQGSWWDGFGGGTIAHSAIACFSGDISETMICFSRILPVEIPRIALVDFNNDCVGDSLKVCKAMFNKYEYYVNTGNIEEAKKYKLSGIRTDTSSNMRDISVPLLGDPALDMGVNPRLVSILRDAVNNAWKNWGENIDKKLAKEYCESIKMIVSGGFSSEKIRKFEKMNVPVDVYAVGSSLYSNYKESVTDFTADIVKIKVNGEWIDMAKKGRRASENPKLEKVW